MINVSEEWIKNQQKLFTSESHIRATLSGDVALNFPREGHTAGDYQLSIATERGHIVGDDTTKPIIDYGTLELNRWLLDGNTATLRNLESHDDAGVIGESLVYQTFANAWGNLPLHNDIPTMENLRAIVVTFDVNKNEYATEFAVRLWGDKESRTFPINGNKQVTRIIPIDTIGLGAIGSISLDVYQWCLPNRRVRINHIHFGFRQVWTKKDIFSYSYRGENSPILTRLPSETVTIEINDIERLYNPLNQDGNFDLLAQRQQMKVEYGFTINNEVKWIEGGTWYLDRWESVRNSRILRLSARDIVMYLEESLFSDFHRRQNPPILAPAVSQITPHGMLTWAARELRDLHGLNLEIDATIPQIPEAFRPTGILFNKEPILRRLHQACVSIGASLKRTSNGNLRAFIFRENDSGYRITRLNQFTKPEVVRIEEVQTLETNIYRAEERRRWTDWEWIPEDSVWRSMNKPIARIVIDDQPNIFTTTLQFENLSSFQAGHHIAGIRNRQDEWIVDVLSNHTNPRVRILNTLVGQLTIEVNLSGLVEVGFVEIFGFDFVSSFDKLKTHQIQQPANVGALNVIVENNEFIVDETRARTMFNNIAQWLRRRNTLAVDCRIDPRIELLDNIEIETEFGTRTMTVTKLEIDYSGSYTGRVSGVLHKED